MNTKRTVLPYVASTVVLFSAGLAFVSHPVTTHADATNNPASVASSNNTPSAADVMNQYNASKDNNGASNDSEINSVSNLPTKGGDGLTVTQVRAQDDGIKDAVNLKNQNNNYGANQNDYNNGFSIGKIVVKAIKQARVDGDYDLAPKADSGDANYSTTFNSFNDGYADGIQNKHHNNDYSNVEKASANPQASDAQSAIIAQTGYNAGYSLAREIKSGKTADFIKGVQDGVAGKANANAATNNSSLQDLSKAQIQYKYGYSIGQQFHNAEALAVTGQKLPYDKTNTDVETYYNGVKDGLNEEDNTYTKRADATYAYRIGLKRGQNLLKQSKKSKHAQAVAEYFRYMAEYKAHNASLLVNDQSPYADAQLPTTTTHHSKKKKSVKKTTKKHTKKSTKKAKKSSKKPKFYTVDLIAGQVTDKNGKTETMHVWAKKNIRIHKSADLLDNGIKDVKKGHKFNVYSESEIKGGYARFRVGKNEWITANKEYVSDKYVAPKPKKKKVKKVEHHAVVRHVAVSRPVTTNYTPTYTKPATTYKPRYVKPVIHHAAKKAAKHVYVGRGGRKITTHSKSYNPVVSLWNYVKRNFSMKTEYSRT